MCGTALSRVVVVDGDADELRAGLDQLGNLLDGRGGVGGVGIGHRLDDDGGVGADLDLSRMLPILTVTVLRRWISGMDDLTGSLPEGGNGPPGRPPGKKDPTLIRQRRRRIHGGYCPLRRKIQPSHAVQTTTVALIASRKIAP